MELIKNRNMHEWSDTHVVSLTEALGSASDRLIDAMNRLSNKIERLTDRIDRFAVSAEEVSAWDIFKKISNLPRD